MKTKMILIVLMLVLLAPICFGQGHPKVDTDKSPPVTQQQRPIHPPPPPPPPPQRSVQIYVPPPQYRVQPYYGQGRIWYPEVILGNGIRYENRGKITLRCNVPKANVYVNSGYAGKADTLKTMRLAPGTYDIKIKDEFYKDYEIVVYVLRDKTLRLDVVMIPKG
jgi:hypothetical protein